MSLAVTPPAPGPEPVEYERRAVEHRRLIRSYHYAAVTTNRLVRDDQPELRIGTRHEVWYDGDRYRCDETPVAGWPARIRPTLPATGPGQPGKRLTAVRSTVCRNCGPNGALVRLLFPGTPVIISRPSDQELADIEADRIDPRGLGLDDGHINGPPPLPGRLADPKVRYTSAEPVEVGGEAAVLVRGTYIKTGSQHRCWVVPGKGYNVLKFELVGKPDAAGKEAPGLFVENELMQDVGSGIWFPKTSRCRRFYLGELAEELHVTVEVAEFNRPAEPAVYTLAGLKVPPGTIVIDQATKHTPQVWTGDKLAGSYAGPLPAETKTLLEALPKPEAAAAWDTPALPPTPDPTRTPWWVYLSAAGLAAVGCGLLALAFRFRR